MLKAVTTILALTATIVFISSLYYRAELKRNLELLDDQERDSRRSIPGIGDTLSYFFDEPEVSQSLKKDRLFSRYTKMGTVIKYSFLLTIVLHITRVCILNLK